jgi:AraC-like DNA-binding protein
LFILFIDVTFSASLREIIFPNNGAPAQHELKVLLRQNRNKILPLLPSRTHAMNKNIFTKDGAFDEEVTFCLERQMIPAWERYGMKHLAVSANTIQEFCDQPLSDQIRAWKKKRKSGKAITYQGAAKSSAIIKSWPEDDQESLRLPVLNYVRAGQAEFQMGDYVAAFPQEHFLLLSPGVPQPAGKYPHLEEPRQGKKCEIWSFISRGNSGFVALAVCYSENDRHVNSGQYYIVNDPHVAQLFHLFSQEAMEKPQDYAKTAFAVLQAFLLLFLREIKTGRFYNRGVNNLPGSAALAESPIDMARQYIGRNLNHPLTIDIVARAVFMGRTNFSRQFHRETGQTFCEYLTERRLEEAKQWLLQEACSVDVVCDFVGLKNSRFHQLFKRHFGMTPKEFREKQKSV